MFVFLLKKLETKKKSKVHPHAFLRCLTYWHLLMQICIKLSSKMSLIYLKAKT